MPSTPQPVPPFRGQVPLIGQRQQQAQAQILQAVHKMAETFYGPVAIQHIASRDEHQEVDVERLRQAARDAHTAAKAFFEGLGVATFHEVKQPAPNARPTAGGQQSPPA